MNIMSDYDHGPNLEREIQNALNKLGMTNCVIPEPSTEKCAICGLPNVDISIKEKAYHIECLSDPRYTQVRAAILKAENAIELDE